MTEIMYMLIKTRYGKERLVKKALLKYPQIREIHEIYGQYDLILKIETEDKEEMKEIIHNKIRLTDNIKSTETLVVADIEDAGEAENEKGDENVDVEIDF